MAYLAYLRLYMKNGILANPTSGAGTGSFDSSCLGLFLLLLLSKGTINSPLCLFKASSERGDDCCLGLGTRTTVFSLLRGGERSGWSSG